jgi:hypothetical protein
MTIPYFAEEIRASIVQDGPLPISPGLRKSHGVIYSGPIQNWLEMIKIGKF